MSAVEPQNDYRDTSTNTEKELNLYPETKIETEKEVEQTFIQIQISPEVIMKKQVCI